MNLNIIDIINNPELHIGHKFDIIFEPTNGYMLHDYIFKNVIKHNNSLRFIKLDENENIIDNRVIPNTMVNQRYLLFYKHIREVAGGGKLKKKKLKKRKTLKKKNIKKNKSRKI